MDARMERFDAKQNRKCVERVLEFYTTMLSAFTFQNMNFPWEKVCVFFIAINHSFGFTRKTNDTLRLLIVSSKYKSNSITIIL